MSGEQESTGLTLTELFSIGTPVVVSLVGAIVYLFRMVTTRLTQAETKLEHCESNHHEANTKLARLEGKVETMTSVETVVGNLIEAIDKRHQGSGDE